jgi:uncharacterized protein (UPF0332 family)
MTQRDPTIVRYRLGRAEECLQIAVDYADKLGDLFRVNRLYYACFYAVMAWMHATGRKSSKHTGVKAFVNKDLVRTGRLSPEAGRLYNNLEVTRLDADYGDFAEVNADDIHDWIPQVREFIDRMKIIIQEDSEIAL